MGYWLGIDVGSTFTAAAVCRDTGNGPGAPEVLALGADAAVMPSVVWLGEGGQVLAGEAAAQRARSDPEQVVRGFLHRIGDEVPMVIAGRAHTGAQLCAALIHQVITEVAAGEGGPASGVILTHPVSWGSYKVEVLTGALRSAGVPGVRLRSTPEAAATGYAAAQHTGPGTTIAVYDLGGTTFEATVVRTTAAGGVSVLGQPHGLEALGGADFDDAVLAHVISAVPALAELDAEDPATLAATAALRRKCTRAKEALSADTEVTIPVLAPGITTQVRLHRAELEDMIRPHITDTLHTLRATLRSAQLDPAEIDAVLLIGGSSRIPLITQILSAELDRPITLDTDPTTAIALGAAQLARPASPIASGSPPAPAAAAPPAETPQPVMSQPGPPSLTEIPLEVEPAELQWRRTRSRRVRQFTLASALALVTVAGVAAVPFLTAHSDTSSAANPLTPAPAAPPPPGAPQPGPPDPATLGDGPANPPAVAGAGGNASPRRAASGSARTTRAAAPGSPAGGFANPGPATAPASIPAPTGVTTSTWTTTWSNPPPATTSSPAPATTTPPPATTTAPPATTTAPQPPPTTKESTPATTTAPAPTPTPSPHRRPPT